MKFKVGDWVTRKPEHRTKSWWIEDSRNAGFRPGSARKVTETTRDGYISFEDGGNWYDPNRFDRAITIKTLNPDDWL